MLTREERKQERRELKRGEASEEERREKRIIKTKQVRDSIRFSKLTSLPSCIFVDQWMLLRHNANGNAQTRDGTTPLHYFIRFPYPESVQHKYFKVLRNLGDKGRADWNHKNKLGESPLHAAALTGEERICPVVNMMLTETDVDINISNEYFRRPQFS